MKRVQTRRIISFHLRGSSRLRKLLITSVGLGDRLHSSTNSIFRETRNARNTRFCEIRQATSDSEVAREMPRTLEGWYLVNGFLRR